MNAIRTLGRLTPKILVVLIVIMTIRGGLSLMTAADDLAGAKSSRATQIENILNQ
jgi:hypothetical protein